MAAGVVERRYARWIDYGPFRFSFLGARRAVDERTGRLTADLLFRVSLPRLGGVGIYTDVSGGWKLTGLMAGEPPRVGFISMCEWDRLEIIAALA